MIPAWWDGVTHRIAEITATARAAMLTHRQVDRTQAEAGGVLLGRILDDGVIVVDSLTAPGDEDVATRFTFRRSRRRAQRAVDRAWQESCGLTNYLGEWHTHPEDVPEPSEVDLADWDRILSMADCHQSNLLFLILGRCEARIWVGRLNDGAIVELRPPPFDTPADTTD